MGLIFISFSTRDQETAGAVRAALNDVGWSTWLCLRSDDNPPGGDWVTTMAERLHDCAAVLLLYSEAAGQSSWVHREMVMAVSLNKPIIVVRLDSSPLPPAVVYLLRNLQWVEAVGAEFTAWMLEMQRALRPWVDQHSPFPIDSIKHRELKVDACAAVWETYFSPSPVLVDGLAVRPIGVAECFDANPHLASKTYQQLHAAVAGYAALAGHAPATSLLPCVAKEDVFLIVALSRDEAAANAATQALQCLVTQLEAVLETHRRRALAGESISLVFGNAKRCRWNSADRSEIADYFTDLGRLRGESAVAPVQPLASSPMALEVDARAREFMKRIVDNATDENTSPWRSLPRRMTCQAAHEHLLQLI